MKQVYIFLLLKLWANT